MYQKVLVPLDGSELAECVLPHVEAIAKGCSSLNVVFVRVVEPYHLPGIAKYSFAARGIDQMEAAELAEAEEYLKKISERYAGAGLNVQTELLRGKAAETITEYAEKNGTDLIVMASHGRSGVSRWAVGSVADRVFRASCVPVLMVRGPGCAAGL